MDREQTIFFYCQDVLFGPGIRRKSMSLLFLGWDVCMKGKEKVHTHDGFAIFRFVVLRVRPISCGINVPRKGEREVNSVAT